MRVAFLKTCAQPGGKDPPELHNKKRQQGTASLASHARPAAAQNISQQDSAPAISQTVLRVFPANPFARRARQGEFGGFASLWDQRLPTSPRPIAPAPLSFE